MPQSKPDISRRADVQPEQRRVLVRKLDLDALRQPQGPESGVNAIIGKWPGEESEEATIALIEEIS